MDLDQYLEKMDTNPTFLEYFIIYPLKCVPNILYLEERMDQTDSHGF